MAQLTYPSNEVDRLGVVTDTRAKILIIEDEQPICLVYAAALIQDHPDYEVVVAYTGAEGIEAAVNEQPDLVILDLELPDMTGVALAWALIGLGILPATPLIVATGLGHAGRLMMESFDAEELLVKPFEMSSLVQIVESTLTRIGL